jgi:acyl-[acyl-carrier-protein]-phospholipid O-acyltransferase/long-chain-fatty-acid--[acyl-carrier-protein] ligase
MVMVTDREGADRAALLNYARARGLNELMVPAEVMVVESLPVMGSGKVDLPVVSEMVAKRVAARSGANA